MERAAFSRNLRRVAFGLACFAPLPVAACAPPSATSRARALAREDRQEEARATLQRRLADHPDDIAARRLLIRLFGSAGDLAAVRAQVDELARRFPAHDPAPYIELGHALELMHRYDEALDAYDQAAIAAPLRPEGPREAGLRGARWGEVALARSRLEEAVRRGANDVETWHTLGLVRLNLGDYDGAAEAYRAGVAVGPKDAECWLGLATVGLARGDAELALDAYDGVVALLPRLASAQLGRAWALTQLGRKAEATRALDLAEELGAPSGPLAKQRAALVRVAPEPLPAAP